MPTLALAQAETPATYRLKEGSPPGEQWVQIASIINQTVNVKAEGEDANQDQIICSLIVMEMKTSEADADGTKTITMTYERIVQGMNMNAASPDAGQTMFYDSRDEDTASPVFAGISLLEDLVITITVDKDDNITNVKGFDEFIDKAKQDAPQAAAQLATLKDSMGDQGIKRTLQRLQQNLPGKAVPIGAEWENSLTMPIPIIGEMKLDIDGTLVEIVEKGSSKLARIKLDGKGKLGNQPGQPGPMDMKFSKVAIKQSGEAFFDLKTRRVVQMDIKQEGTFEGTILDGTLEIDQVLTSTMKVTDRHDMQAENRFASMVRKAIQLDQQEQPAPVNEF
jgi:hypothetical protein